MGGIPPLALAALELYAFALLSIGLTRDWRLLHEDNGAVHSTLALSHVRLGLATTRAHDVFFEPRTGQLVNYGHHPPATALILAGAFVVTGSNAPYIARLVPIAFHLGSLLLFLELLSRVFPRGPALLGGFLMATLPMSAYFGRIVNYEPLCLFAVLLQLMGYAAFRQDGSRSGLARLSLGILIGGLIDWAALFFAAAITLALVADAWPRPRRALALAAVPLLSAVAIVVFDVWHLWYASHGALTALHHVLSGQWPSQSKAVAILPFVRSQLEVLRRYYTHAGLISTLVVGVFIVARPRASLSTLPLLDETLLRHLLAITGGAALGYVLAAPSWAQVHAYWQFYALPFVVLAMLLVWQALRQAARGSYPRIARVLLVLFLVDVCLTSASTLYYRHRTPSVHAMRQTAWLRATFLAPDSSRDPGAPKDLTNTPARVLMKRTHHFDGHTWRGYGARWRWTGLRRQ